MSRIASDSCKLSAPEGYDFVACSVFAAFLISIFFLNGAIANAVVFLSFAAAWIAIARSPHRKLPQIPLLAVLFITAITLRLLLPPYGAEHTLAGAAVTRSLLIVGLYGLTLYVYARVPFSYILLLIVVVASASTALALTDYYVQGDFNKRLAFLGRASHPIFGAGAVATAALAAVTSLAFPPRSERWGLKKIGLGFAIAMLITAIAMTGSRGPMIALALALVASPIVMLTRSPLLPIAFGFGAWALVTGSVVLEPQIREALCPLVEVACRPSLRQGVWAATADMVAQHPLWGYGYAFRFDGVPHAHNSYFGLALNYGLPILLLFIGLMSFALAQTAQIQLNHERFFIVAALIFANGFMGSDLSDPARFFNTHYLFLWFPLFLAFFGGKEPAGTAGRSKRTAEKAAGGS